MAEKSKPPTLIVQRSVENYGVEEFRLLRIKALLEKSQPEEYVERIFKSYRRPSALILRPEIVVNAVRNARRRLPADHLDALKDKFDTHFAPNTSKKVQTPTLPSLIVNPLFKGKRFLTLAPSQEIIAEHDDAMEIVYEHVGLAPPSREALQFGRLMCRATIVTATGAKPRPALDLAESIINSHDSPYPKQTTYERMHIGLYGVEKPSA
jgi:hypothetical protein